MSYHPHQGDTSRRSPERIVVAVTTLNGPCDSAIVNWVVGNMRFRILKHIYALPLPFQRLCFNVRESFKVFLVVVGKD